MLWWTFLEAVWRLDFLLSETRDHQRTSQQPKHDLTNKVQSKVGFKSLFAHFYFSMRPAQRVCFGVAASRLASLWR
jgi:hypothetical protein